MPSDFDFLGAQKRVFRSSLRPLERLVALAILDHWSKTSEPWPSLARLQEWSGLGRRAVISAIKGLETAGALRIECKRPMRLVNGRREVVPNAKPTNHYDLSGLMTLPVRDAHQCARDTSAPDAPVREGTPTSSPEAPVLVSEGIPKEPSNKPRKELRGATSSAPPRKPAKRGWRKVPDSWQPRDEERQLAHELGVDFEDQLGRYRDHTFKSAMLDADATFRNWLRKAADWKQQRGPRRAKLGPPQQGLAQGVREGTL